MADFVQVVVQVDKSQLASLQSDVKKINGQTVKIDVDPKSITAAKNEIVKLSKTFDEQGNLKRSVKDVELAFGRMERTIEVVGKKGTTVTTTLTNNLKAQAQAAKSAETEYAKYAAQVAREQSKIVSPLQAQINAITGVSREFKSAEESARFFQMRGLTPTEQALNEQEAAAKRSASATKNYGNAAATAAKQTESLWDNIQKFARWYLIGNAFSAMVRSLRDALDTMRAVDSELVTIRKVTGFSDSQIAGIREQAYATASAYGVGAADYLSSVAQFSRAGYKEQSEALAELSTKTQIVGDTTAEVANQFLLSVDAAYKYKGSIQELSKVLDGANELDNKYATSIEKIAEGMGIVAPVAEQMHVTIGELAAGIGTITAVTQRSGSEAARALRALFLNIAGDTKTEIDEGVTWTTGEIEGLREVVKLYAKDAYDAAQASKSVIDPMRAMEGLAKSMQEGVLSEEKLVEMVSDIGGKLRTSQLLAIIQNWDMYSSMLNDFANAAGSADKEVSNALDSWERKTAQLSNAWAEFISHLIDTKEIKGALDIITKAIELLDSDFGRFAVTVGLSMTAVALLSNAFWAVQGSAIGATIATEGLFAAMEGLGAAMLASPLFWGAAAAAVVYALVKAVDKLTVTYTEQKEKLKALQDQYEQTFGVGSEYDQLLNKAEELTDEEKRRLAVLKAEADELQRQVTEQKRLTFLSWRNGQTQEVLRDNGDRVWWETEDITADTAKYARNKLTDLSHAYERGRITAGQYRDQLQSLTVELKESAENIQSGQDAGEKLTDSERELLTVYNAIVDILTSVTEATGGFADKQKDGNKATSDQVTALKALQETLDGLSGNLSVVTKALQDFNEDGRLSYSTISSLITSFKDLGDDALNGYIERLTDANLTGDELKRVMGAMTVALVEQKIAAGELTEQNKALVVMMLREEGVANADEVATSLFARAAKRAADAAADATGAVRDFNGVGINTSGKVQAIRNVSVAFEGVRRSAIRAADAIAAFNGTKWTKKTSQSQGGRVGTFLPKTTTPEYDDIPDDYGGGGGGGSSSDSSDPKLDAYKSDVELLKSELDLLEKSGAAEDKRIAKMREIQAALHAQAEYMRSIGADQKEINALSSAWWDYSKKILDLQKEIADNLKKELDTAVSEELDKAKSARDAEIEAIDKQIEQLNKQNEAADKQNKLQQLKADIIEKQNALLAAQAERNIRVYNKATGQWEWTANTANIRSAEDALASARKSLSDYEAEQSQDAEIEALNARKAALNAEYDALEAEWKSITKSLQEPTRGIADILKDVEKNGAARLKEQIEKINGLLGNLASYIGSAGGYDAGAGLSVSGDVQSFYGGLDKAGIATASNSGLTTSMAAKAAETYNSMHNGDVYEMNGVEISEQKARATTVYEMAQMARNLVLHNGVKSYA